MAKYAAAMTRAPRARASWCSIAAAGSCRSTRRNMSRSSRSRDGSSTTQSRSGRGHRKSEGRPRQGRPRGHCGVGITNQRETTVVWDRHTGKPVYNALVWQDTRPTVVDAFRGWWQDRFRAKTGLPLATYFCGSKIAWILDNVDGARARRNAVDFLRQHRQHG